MTGMNIEYAEKVEVLLKLLPIVMKEKVLEERSDYSSSLTLTQ